MSNEAIRREVIGERLGIEKGERVLAFFVYWLPVSGCRYWASGCWLPLNRLFTQDLLYLCLVEVATYDDALFVDEDSGRDC